MESMDMGGKKVCTMWLFNQEYYNLFHWTWTSSLESLKSAKDIWEVLEVTHEGTNDVKRARKHALIQQYELFKMQQGESIAEVQKRFTHIVNLLIGSGKESYKEELNIKLLKCLDKSW